MHNNHIPNPAMPSQPHLDSFIRHHLERRRRCVIKHPCPKSPKKSAKTALAVNQAHSLSDAELSTNFALCLQAGLDDIEGIGNLSRHA